MQSRAADAAIMIMYTLHRWASSHVSAGILRCGQREGAADLAKRAPACVVAMA